MFKTTLFALAAAAPLLLGSAGASQALPMAPVSGGDAMLTHVAGGCGPGWRPARFGRCVPMRRVMRRCVTRVRMTAWGPRRVRVCR